MESSSPAPAPAPVVAGQGNGDAGRPKRLLTQGEIEYAMANERRPWKPPGLDRFARLPDGNEILALLASAGKHFEELEDMQMEYKERVLRQYADKGYVEVIDRDDDDEEEDNEWDHDMVFSDDDEDGENAAEKL